MKNDNEIIEFVAIIDKLVKSTENFKVYGVTPIEKTNNIKFNKYGNVSISGDIQELTLGLQYYIKGIENKWGYTVINIRRDKPTTKSETINFLKEVITKKQAEALLEVYPNILIKIINNDLIDIDLSKIKGIGEKRFNTIKRKVIENFPLIDFIDEFSDYNITINTARKMYKNFTSIERMKEKMIADPYTTLCSINGIGFKKADSMILSVDKNKNLINSKQRMLACINYCLNENEKNGHTWISLDDLIQNCNKLTSESMEWFLESLKSEDIYVEGDTKRISKKKTYLLEKYIANKIIKMLKNNNRWLIDISKYKNISQFGLTDEQMNSLNNLCKYNVSLLVGNAGSGKSFTIETIIKMLDDNDKTYMLMTPTGKSAMVLSEYTNRDAGTIHRKLGYNPSQGWLYNSENQLNVDVVIVDENGMTDVYLMVHLLEAIDETKTKILFVQDDAQLPSVSCGNCAYDLINSGIIPITKLTKIFRYGEGGLLQVATKIRNGEQYVDNSCEDIREFGSKGDYCLIPTDDDSMSDYVVNIYKKLLQQGNNCLDIMVLSAKNVYENGANELNKIIQEAINPYSNDKKYVKYSDDKIFRVGDIVLQMKNNYKAITEFGEEETITNGDIGKIINIDYNYIYVQYKRFVITYDVKEDLDQIQLGYAMSIHKSQGSGVKNVILVTPRSHTWNLNRNLLYVAPTRAKERCFHLSLPSTINHGLRYSIELQRNTFLKDLLKTLYIT